MSVCESIGVCRLKVFECFSNLKRKRKELKGVEKE